MSSCLQRCVLEDAKVTEKQGIVSILGSDCERTKSASLRRTLSADMSSKKWRKQHGFSFSPLKKIASSEGLAVSIKDSSSFSSEEGEFDTWSSIQEEEKKKNEPEKKKMAEFDIWSSIVCQNADSKSEQLPPPYIHPLVKKSASSLSKKSLEVCTESLGSETGSDGFFSYPTSEAGDSEDDKEDQQLHVSETCDREEFEVVKYNYGGGRKWPPRCFPPTLPSLSHLEGAAVRMRSYRGNGRLVLEAVSVPSRNNFHAQRQDGRLVLTFINTSSEVVNEEDNNNITEVFEEEFENFEEHESEIDEDEDEEEEEAGDKSEVQETRIVMDQAPKFSSGVINVHRLALMMNKTMLIENKFNKVVKFEEEEEEEDAGEPIGRAQSLPPRPRAARLIPTPPLAVKAAAAAASLNAYEYCWPAKPMASGKVLNPLNQQLPPAPFKNSSNNKFIVSKNLKGNGEQQGLFLRENKRDYSVPLSRGCKEPRSLLFREPQILHTHIPC